MVVKTTIRDEQNIDVRRTGRSEVLFINPWGSSQPLERTYGKPGSPGAGARKAVRRFGKTLQELADN